MRIAVYALLLVNLLYAAWAKWIDVPAPPAPSAIAKLPPLKLLSDVPLASRSAVPVKAILDSPVCASIGPFDDPAITAKAANLLLAKGLAPQQRVTEAPAVRRLWVYLDQFRSDTTEMRVLHRLEAAGIDDAEAMPEAAGGRRVSLGLFTDNAKAQSRIKAVQRMGFHPLTAERVLPATVYWLDLTLPSSSTPVPLKDVSDLQPGATSPISVQPCGATPPQVAPSPQNPAPASSSITPKPVRKAAVPAAASSGIPNLPKCRPGGPVPCVAAEPKKATDPSVF